MATYSTIYEVLKATAARRPAAAALVFEGIRLTYAALMAKIERTASALSANGIGPGDAFAIYAQNSPEVLYGFYAAAKLGAIFVPINPNMTPAEVRYIFSHCEAKALFYDGLLGDPASLGLPAERIFSVTALGGEPAAAVSTNGPPVLPEDTCVIIYTSGSTGAPKAVVLDHRAEVDVCAALREMWGISETDTTLVALPLGYLYGLSTASAVGLSAGGVVVVMPKFRPQDVLKKLIATRATVYHGVPTMYSMMLEYAEQNSVTVDLSGVRQLISAGAPLPDELIGRFEKTFHKRLQNYYASTECTPVFGVNVGDDPHLPDGAAGKLAPRARVRIVGPDGRDVAPGVDGEIYMRAAATMREYYKSPELTASVLEDGWFKSGDLGRVDERGYYYITGRIKDIIIRGGANIAPAEVEKALSSHPSVQDAAVIGAPDRIFGEVPVAFIVTRHGATATPEALIHHTAQSLADFKIPRCYHFVEALPVGKTGKVDKLALKEWLRTLTQ